MQNWVLGPSWYIPMPPISMNSKMLLYQTHFSQEGVQAERGGEAAHQGQCWKWALEIDVLTLFFGLHAPVAYKEWYEKKKKNDTTNAIFHQAIRTHHFLPASSHTYCGHIVSKVLSLSWKARLFPSTKEWILIDLNKHWQF